MNKKGKFLKNNKGETLVETLVALLIGTFALMMLPMAISAAAKVDRDVEKASIYAVKEDGETPSGNEVTATITSIN